MYPGAGLLVMVIEALRQLADQHRPVKGYLFEEGTFNSAFVVPEEGVESTLHLQRIRSDIASDFDRYSFRLHIRNGTEWIESARGTAVVEYKNSTRPIDHGQEEDLRNRTFRQLYLDVISSPGRDVEASKLYEILKTVGLGLGPTFKTMDNIFYTNNNEAVADITPWTWSEYDLQTHIPLIHPTTLDAIAQTFTICFTRGATFIANTNIPTRVSNLWLSEKLGQLPLQPVLKSCSRTTSLTHRNMTASIFCLDQHTQELLINWEEMETTTVATNKSLDDGSQRCFDLSWQPDLRMCTKEEINHICIGNDTLADSKGTQFSSILADDLNLSPTPLKTTHVMTASEIHCPETVRYIELVLYNNQGIELLEYGGTGEEPNPDLLRCMQTARNATQNMSIGWQRMHYTYTHTSEDHVQNVIAQYQNEDISFEAITLLIGQSDLPSDLQQKQFDIIMVHESAVDVYNPKAIASFFQPLLKDGGSLIVRTVSTDQRAAEAVAAIDGQDLNGKQSVAAVWSELAANSELWNTHTSLASSCEILTTQEVLQIPTIQNAEDLNIISENSALAQALRNGLDKIVGATPHVASFNDCSTSVSSNKRHFIFLDDASSSIVLNMNQTTLSWLKSIMLSAASFLWVSIKSGGSTDLNVGVLNGLTRTLRNEYQSVQLATLVLEDSQDIEREVQHICSVWRSNWVSSQTNYETEIREIGGRLCLGRLIESSATTRDVASRVSQEVLETIQLKDSPPLALTIGDIGVLETLHYREWDAYATELASNEVEIEVRAMGLNFMDILTALGRVKQNEIGTECAGIVKRVGSGCQHLHPGDYVVCIALDCFKTIAIVNGELCLPMPRGMSFVNAACMGIGFVTSYHGLVESARLQKGESVLITAATGGTGQAAIQIAQDIGAVVYATVGSEAKKQMLIDLYNIPAAHIFYSRDLSFAQGIRRTLPKGVDVVFNSLSGEKLTAAWSCIAPFGRFVEIGKRDIHTRQALPMFHFARNVSFFAVDIAGMGKERPLLAQHTLRKTLYNRAYNAPEPIHIFPVSQTEDAFRFMQTGNHTGKVCIEIGQEDTIKVSLL